jgi:hypothetical protein
MEAGAMSIRRRNLVGVPQEGALAGAKQQSREKFEFEQVP